MASTKRIETIESDKSVIPINPKPFCLGVKYGDTIFVSGNIGLDPKTSKLVEGGVGDRTRQVLRNISGILEDAGSNLQKVIKANIYLTSMSDFGAMNKAYLEFFPDYLPARTCIGVRELPFGTDVEIECTAAL